MDVRVISLLDDPPLLSSLRRMYGPSAGVAAGVDLRSSSLDTLYQSRHIGEVGYTTLRQGRKWHWELNSKGGVGLAEAVRLALRKDVSTPLLLFEDDCVISDEAAFRRDVQSLRSHQDQFDVAVFGAVLHEGTRGTPVPFLSKGWFRPSGDARFILAHCVFYTPSARRLLSSYLEAHEQHMQIDGLYSFLASRGSIRLLLQLERGTAHQSLHLSSIQTDQCFLCDLQPAYANPSQDILAKAGVVLAVSAVVACVAGILFARNRA